MTKHLLSVKDNPLVLIEWVDTSGPSTVWEHLSDVKPSEECVSVTVGYLYQDDDLTVSVIQNCADILSEDIHVRGIFSIPRGCIRNIYNLQLGKRIYSEGKNDSGVIKVAQPISQREIAAH